jgi:hypothetical protein
MNFLPIIIIYVFIQTKWKKINLPVFSGALTFLIAFQFKMEHETIFLYQSKTDYMQYHNLYKVVLVQNTTINSNKSIYKTNAMSPWVCMEMAPWAYKEVKFCVYNELSPCIYIEMAPWAYNEVDLCIYNELSPCIYIEKAPWAYNEVDLCVYNELSCCIYIEMAPWAYNVVHLCVYNELSYCVYIEMGPWAYKEKICTYNELNNHTYNGAYINAYDEISSWESNIVGPWFHKKVTPLIYEDLATLWAYNKPIYFGYVKQHTLYKHVHQYVFNPFLNIYFYKCIRYQSKIQSQIVDKMKLHYKTQLTQSQQFVNTWPDFIFAFICLLWILYFFYTQLSVNFCIAKRARYKQIKPFYYNKLTNNDMLVSQISTLGGGTKKFEFEYHQLMNIILPPSIKPENEHDIYTFFAYCSLLEANIMMNENANLVVCRIDTSSVASFLNHSQAKQVARHHNIHIDRNASLLSIISYLQTHRCNKTCYDNVFVFTPKNKSFGFKKSSPSSTSTESMSTVCDISELFPPLPPSKKDIELIVQGFCAATNPSLFMEAGCAVCGLLFQLKYLTSLDDVDLKLDPLSVSGVTRQERASNSHVIKEIPGPVLDPDCRHVCKQCIISLKKGKMPKMSLANGLWLGKVPNELQDLKYAEMLLIARVRHNQCIVKVKASGRYKMRANAIVFENPIPKVYNLLPPPIRELDQILAFMFTGPCKPTKDDLKRTPLLVRRNKIAKALQWLILNHSDYEGVEISEDNLNQYPLEDVPVVIDYRESILNKEAEESSLHDTEGDDGFDGDCSFVVHGLYGEEYTTMTTEGLKAVALEHLTQNNKMLFIGHSKEPLTSFRNPQLFPSMMPWLFPYGLGGICNPKHHGHTSTREFIKHLLMYHDKRFQMDKSFALITWNQEQIANGTTAGYLTANKARFPEIIDRLTNLDTEVLQKLITHLKKGGKMKPNNEKEEACYRILSDLDFASAKVSGSVGSKKHLRNQIWSLISYIGAPSWFITLSPADVKHPICLYYADTKEEFCPDIRSNKESFDLVANNPVAAARFFHLICETFVKEVLGVGSNHKGIYGNTNGYYGTVEQQGRLTLHLHMLIWIEHAISPQSIRDKVMDSASDFQKRLVQYLESVCQGQCLKGTMAEVKQRIDHQTKFDHNYKDPTRTLPIPPPSTKCKNNCDSCDKCILLKNWWSDFENTVDDLLIRSNRHICTQMKEQDEGKEKIHKACLNKRGECKARFPREVIPKTMVDPLTGALRLKKGEAWMNTFNIVTTYLCRCNTDCTSLLSGTAIKAVVAYVCDYISKSGLSAYTAFDTIRQVLSKNSELIGGSNDRKTAARTLMIKMINALTAKMEMGSPMAAMYLLGNPDHYTSHKFIDFYWKNYVHEAEIAWNTSLKHENNANVVIQRSKEQYIGLSNVYDYIYRPSFYKNMDLFNWIRLSKKSKRTSKQQKQFNICQERLKKYGKFTIDTDMIDTESDVSSTLVDDIDELDMFQLTSDKECNKQIHDMMQIPDCIETDFSDDEIILKMNTCNEILTNDVDKDLAFIELHPQYQTHHVHCIKDTDKIVPNFMNGSLPRRDHGDQEYYCLTMLVLFKPWRSGKDLRKDDQSWHESFNEYNFSDKQKELMDNFNIRYECNDARDDYSARNKNVETFSCDKMDTANLNMNNLFDNFESDIKDENDIYTLPNAKYLSKLAQMAEIEHIIQNSGWLDESPNGIMPATKINFQPDENTYAAQWNAIVTKAKDYVIQHRGKHIPTDMHGVPLFAYNYNEVIVADASYINKRFHAESREKQMNIDNTVKEYNLNVEQERAFRVIANHATLNDTNQLKMYLGGMGGTGKSQVIRSLISLFEKNNEAHRIMILAPTGSAAALLNGSTYHSVLGVGSDNQRRSRNEQTTLAQVRTKLEGVDYIFIDEISMIACHELYRISAQLTKSRNCTNSAFGGINMIFSGDFAQLKPVMGQALYSESVETILSKSQTQRGQESAIGKALWHQVTTVIILRQNMRQQSQSPEDAKLRLALENMRFGACTPDDIKYLETRIAGKGLDCPKLSDKKLRNVSIITARNVQKDHINYLGALRFAKDTGQTLTHFYSIDKWGEEADISVQKVKKRYKTKKILLGPTIGPKIQEMLWNMHHSDTDHIPGKLSLCIGMPVMIRNNDATELCITKGQEGYVVGWQSSDGPYQSKILDTLFVKLDEPAKTVNLDGLPENVVPLTRMSKNIKCITPSGINIPINRSQIQVLPNFAMTDYACQGKTRPLNVVDLSYCHDHQSYYTCLSHSATSEGTVIVQGFNAKIITKGISGYLRQEFRELEILNEITRLKYEQQLPYEMNGLTRNMLLRQFQMLKGTGFAPKYVPEVITWSDKKPMNKVPQVVDINWQLIENISNTENQFIPAQGTAILEKVSNTPVYRILKRKASNNIIDSNSKVKTTKLNKQVDNDMVENPSNMKKKHQSSSPELSYCGPLGMDWDSNNYSCAYDSLFTILCNIYLENPAQWTNVYHQISIYLRIMAKGCFKVLKNQQTLNTIRDAIRLKLMKKNADIFPSGTRGTDIADLGEAIFNCDISLCTARLTCSNCNYNVIVNPPSQIMMHITNRNFNSTNKWFTNWQKQNTHACHVCQTPQVLTRDVSQSHNLFIFGLSVGDIAISKSLRIFKPDGTCSLLPVRGIIYSGSNHFVAQFIDSKKNVWYHDGMTTRTKCVLQCHLKTMNERQLMTYGEKQAVMVIYGKS